MPFHLFVFFTSSSSESLRWEHVSRDVLEGQCYWGKYGWDTCRRMSKSFSLKWVDWSQPRGQTQAQAKKYLVGSPCNSPQHLFHQVDNWFAISQNSRLFHLCCCLPSSLHVPVLEFHFFSLPHRCPSPCPPPPPPSRPCSSSSSPSGCWLVSSGILTRQSFSMIMISSPHSSGASNKSTGR